MIDVLLGSVSRACKQRLAWLRDAVEDAQVRRKGLPVKIGGLLVAAPDEELRAKDPPGTSRSPKDLRSWIINRIRLER